MRTERWRLAGWPGGVSPPVARFHTHVARATLSGETPALRHTSQNACIVEIDQTAPRRFSGLAFSAYAQSIRIMADS